MTKLSKQSHSKILISGASGFIGSHLSNFLQEQGFEVYTLVRRESKTDYEISWDPSKGFIDKESLEKIKPEIIINLSGASIAKGIRWSKKRKNLIYKSRIDSTKLLAQTIETLPGVHTFISTSAVGYYGSSVSDTFDEESSAGRDFLAEVCADWEKASQVTRSDVRVVNPRFGVVVDTSGGFLKQILTPIKLLGGAVLGKGDNRISWISRHDLARAILEIIENNRLQGPVNMVAPRAISQKQLIREIAREYHRPVWLHIPKVFLTLIFGKEKTEVFLLADQQVVPQKLVDNGFEWEDADVRSILN